MHNDTKTVLATTFFFKDIIVLKPKTERLYENRNVKTGFSFVEFTGKVDLTGSIRHFRMMLEDQFYHTSL